MTTGAAVWHDVECASYGADLPLWRELADGARGPILDVGCGTGRVALHLAMLGHDVTGVDPEPEFIEALAARARERGLRLRAEVGDGRSLSLGGARFELAIAPMQVVQLLGGPVGRAALLASLKPHLRPGGTAALAIADPFEGIPEDDAAAAPPLPDVLEDAGWVYSSIPVAVRNEPDGTAIDRLRQAVSPTGELDESMATIVLDRVEAGELEDEGRAAGFRVLPRRAVPPTDEYVGSAVIMLGAG